MVDRIEVLNVDRLAYRIVSQARGTHASPMPAPSVSCGPSAAVDAGLPFTPVFLQHEWEQVILAQDLRTSRRT